MPKSPRVFISYSHDDEAHKRRVLALADRLRKCGVAVVIDQYFQSPAEGWPLWCEKQIEQAEQVILVCTATYHRRVRNEEEPGKGRGVLHEAHSIRQELYNDGGVSTKFVPVLYSDGTEADIPNTVRRFTRFVVDREEGFSGLYRLLTDQPETPPPDIGTLLLMPPQPRPGLAEAPLPPPSAIDDAPSVPATIPPAYVDWLRRSCDDVSLLGQTIEKSHGFTLSHVYVPALTRPASKRARPAEGEQQPIPLLRRLDAESIYVPAAAGAGKSTFCKWAALQSIGGPDRPHPVRAPKEFAERAPKRLAGRLPVLVRLREFWAKMDCGRGLGAWRRVDLERALAAWIDGSPPDGLTGGHLLAHLKGGSAFLLLDGLDEVPISEKHDDRDVFPRELLLSGLADALPAWRKAGNRILLTSRPYGLEEAGLHRLGLPDALLEPLPQALQDLFVSRWFHTLRKPEKAPELIATIRDRDVLAPLVENPMLLTALCVLHDAGGRLPEDRRELYERIVNNVLFHRFPGDMRIREPIRARLEAIALGMHEGEPDSPRSSPAAEVSYLEVDRILRDFAAEDQSYEEARVGPAAKREELVTRSGLLLPRPNARAVFQHLSFQEFLAAERILRTEDALDPVFRQRSAVPEWRLTLMFLFAGKVAGKTPRWGSKLLESLIADQGRAAVKADPARAVFIAEAISWYLAKQHPLPEDLKEHFRRLALDAIEDEVELRSRCALGLCLGRLQDPRIRSLRDPAAYVEVPAGSYPSGDDKTGRVEIAAPFRIARYPVTNGQYAEFVDAGGYSERQWWSDAGWAWREKAGVTEPGFWRDRRWNESNQPVVGVSFWVAEACSAWAGGRLPTEEEWEAATRGPKGLAYPWGDDWQDGICNTAEAGLGVTSPVGLFPRARQAGLGIEDLAGNVWEWCDSLYDAHDKDFPDARVLRGGSWDFDRDFARSASRSGSPPGDRYFNVGFRVVCSSPIFDH